MDIQPLSKHIKTSTDVDDFSNTLDQLSDSLYKTNGTAEDAIQQALSYELAVLITKLAAQQSVNMANKSEMQKFLQDVRNAVNAIPAVRISLAFNPKAKLVGLIHDWFYRNFRKMVVLDIVIKPDVIAGCIVSYNGKYYDYSLGKESKQILGGLQG